MIRIYVDFNSEEEKDIISIRIDSITNGNIDKNDLREGMIVILYEEGLECEAVLCRGKNYEWAGKILPNTTRDI